MSNDVTDPHERHRRRVRRWSVAAAVVVVVAVAGIGTFAYLWTHGSARPVSLAEARRRYLAGETGDAAAGIYTPRAGVYAYTGSGSEELSTPPKSQSEGPEMPGTVRHTGQGCWTFRLDYSTNSWRTWRYCADAGGLRETGSRVYQRWDFVFTTVDNLAVVRCRPAAVVIETGMRPGAEWESECTGENSAIAGTTVTTGTHRFVGREPVEVDGRTVDTLHFRDDRVVSGAQRGTEEFDLWLTDDGLLVRGRQRIVVDSDSPLGNVTYTQEGTFSLVSALP